MDATQAKQLFLLSYLLGIFSFDASWPEFSELLLLEALDWSSLFYPLAFFSVFLDYPVQGSATFLDPSVVRVRPAFLIFSAFYWVRFA